MALATNLVSYWKLDGDFVDAISAYNLTATGTPGDVTGKIGNAKSFVGAGSSYASIAAGSCANLNLTGDFTVSAWVYTTNIAGGWAYTYILSKRFSPTTDRGFYLNTQNGFQRFWASGALTPANVDAAVAMVDNTWYHIVGVYDKTNSLLKIFVNNAKTQVSVSGTAPSNSDVPFYIGLNSNNSVEGFSGSIDEVGIWNRALTDSEVASLYNSGNGLAYPFAGVSPSSSLSPSISPSASVSPSISPSSSQSPSASLSPSSSISASISPSASISASLSSSASISASLSPSASVSPSPSQGFIDYTRQALNSLPANDNDLATIYSDAEIAKTKRESNQVPDIEDDIPQPGALQYMIHQFKTFVGSQPSCNLELTVESTLPTTSSPAYLQIFNHSSGVWETLDSNNSYSAEITFELDAVIPDLTNYKNADYIISVRTWQLAI